MAPISHHSSVDWAARLLWSFEVGSCPRAGDGGFRMVQLYDTSFEMDSMQMLHDDLHSSSWYPQFVVTLQCAMSSFSTGKCWGVNPATTLKPRLHGHRPLCGRLILLMPAEYLWSDLGIPSPQLWHWIPVETSGLSVGFIQCAAQEKIRAKFFNGDRLLACNPLQSQTKVRKGFGAAPDPWLKHLKKTS